MNIRMKKDLSPIENEIKNKIYIIREMQIMLDTDLAQFYNVETKVLNQAVKRKENVKVSIYIKYISSLLSLDLAKYHHNILQLKSRS